jgi:DNA-binding NarL/FixJ family response regulator
MPGIDGIETLRTIRKEKLGEGIPIVMLTNQNDEKDIEESKKLGVRGYIVKSAATPSEVVAEVVKIIKENKG